MTTDDDNNLPDKNPRTANLPAAKGIERRSRRSARAEPVRRGAQERSHRTRESILRAAKRVFARNGFTEGKIDTISRLSRTHDRMIYYYFGSKARLFVEVLERTYEEMNKAEASIPVNFDQPTEALRQIVHFVWNYYLENPEFITLLNSENLLKGKHIKKSSRAGELSSPAVGLLDKVLESGVKKGVFRDDLAARDLYLIIAALGYFYLSNHYTLSVFLDADLLEDEALVHWQHVISDVVLRAVMVTTN